MSLPRVFVIGASTTIQFGPYLEKELEGRFHYDRKRDSGDKRAEDNLDIPQGASGGDSSMVVAYMRQRLQEDPIPADYLLVSTGMHDIKTKPGSSEKQVGIGKFEENLHEIIELARRMNLELVWLRIPPVVEDIHNPGMAFHRYAADVDAYNSVADRIMKEAGVEVIDFYTFCLDLVPHSLIDHVHYNDEAREKQAKFLAHELTRRFLNKGR